MWAAIAGIAILGFIQEVIDTLSTDDVTPFKIGTSICLAVIIGLSVGCALKEADDLTPLYGHIDHSKTRTLEENGEVTDLYLTIDGTEYHFELKDGDPDV